MVIVRLIGGLGNQMFQYAAGRALSLRQHSELKLDRTLYGRSYDRTYQLNVFSIEEDWLDAQRNRLLRMWVHPSTRIIRGLARRAWPGLSVCTVVDKERGYDHSVTQKPGITWLRGFWQSEKYFAEVEHIIRREFTFRSPPDRQNAQALRDIKSREAVCVHVRRGDYVSDPRNMAIHGTCGLDYYHRAMAYIAKRATNPHWIIFSDEPGWAATHLTFFEPRTIMSHNSQGRNWEDLRLMTACKHFIIANSSFSWWGAWLAQHVRKRVVAPKTWFSGDPSRCPDIVPDSWMRL